MAYSSYQVQRMMERLKRARTAADTAEPALTDRMVGAFTEVVGLGAMSQEAVAEPPAPMRVVSGFDHVRLSAQAIQEAAKATALHMPAGPRRPTVTIIDDSPLPLPTRVELERRAGSFMRPPQMPSPPPIPIPRTRRPAAPIPETDDPVVDILDGIHGETR